MSDSFDERLFKENSLMVSATSSSSFFCQFNFFRYFSPSFSWIEHSQLQVSEWERERDRDRKNWKNCEWFEPLSKVARITFTQNEICIIPTDIITAGSFTWTKCDCQAASAACRGNMRGKKTFKNENSNMVNVPKSERERQLYNYRACEKQL